MSVAAAFAPHLPYLRRYARSLTGSQKSGDAFVRAALEALLQGEEEISESDPPKIALYRLFHAVWAPSGERFTRGEGTLLDSLPPRGREALLLTAIEGFDADEVADILRISVAEVEDAVARAREAIEAEFASRIMIIEDEPIIALDLQGLVERMGHSTVGIATTHKEATALALREHPDLILADIKLADGSSGLEAVQEILKSFEVPVIFITAYPERLLTGERPEPTYLIAKPFLPDTVRTTISQALFLHRGPRRAAAAQA